MEKQKFKKRHFLILGLLLAGMAAVGITLLVQEQIRHESSPSSIAAILTRQLGCPVTIEKSELLPLGRLMLEKITITMPQELQSSEEVAFIPEAAVHFNPWLMLLRRETAVNSIELTEPRVTLSKSFIEWIRKRQSEGAGALPTLLIRSGTLHIGLSDEGKEWSFYKVKGKVSTSRGDSDADLSGTSAGGSETWRFEGKSFRGGESEFRLTVGNLDLEKTLKTLSVSAPLQGECQLTIQAPRGKGGSFKGTVESKTVRVRKLFLTDCTCRFSSTGDRIEIESLEGKTMKGSFKGKGTLSFSRGKPELVLGGDLTKLHLADAIELFPQFPRKGILNAKMIISAKAGDLKAKGTFALDRPDIPGLTGCSSMEGAFSLAGESLTLTRTEVTAREGKGRLEGTFSGSHIDMSIKARDLILGGFLPDTSPLAIPPGGTLEGTLRGTMKENQFQGTLQLPALMVGEKQFENVEITGDLDFSPGACAFSHLKIGMGKDSFLATGSLKEDGKGATGVSLEGIPLSTLGFFLPGSATIRGGSLSLRGTSRKDSFTALLTSGKGELAIPGAGSCPFSSLSVTLESAKDKRLSVKGDLRGEHPLQVEGTMDKKASAFTIKTGKLSLPDLSMDNAQVTLSLQGNLVSGSLSAQELSLAAFKGEKAGKMMVTFKGRKEEPLAFTGSLTWRDHPFHLSGTMAPDLLNCGASAPDFPLASLMGGKKTPLEGKAALHVTLRRAKGKNSVTIVIKSAVPAKAKQAQPAFDAQLSVHDDVLDVTSLHLGKDGKALSLKGTVNLKDSSLALKGEVKDETLADLASLGGTLPPGVKGSLTGNLMVEGTPDAPSFSFKGTCRDLVMHGLACGNGRLAVSQAKGSLAGTFTPDSADRLIGSFVKGEGRLNDIIAKGWKALSLTFAGKGDNTITFSGTGEQSSLGKVTFKGERSGDDMSMDISPGRLVVDDMTFPEPALHITTKGEKLQGTISSKSGTVRGTSLTSPQFSFEEKEKGLLAFTGTCTLPQGDASMTGESRGSAMDLKVTIAAFSLKNLELLKGQGANLSGTARLEAHFTGGEDKGFTFRADSDSIRWKDKKLPRISLEGEKKKSLLIIPSLKIYVDEKPLSFSGNMYPEKEKILLNGRMEGTSITPLVDFVGGKAPDVQGALAGSMSIEGDMKKPDFHYQGRILNLVYQGKQMGDGNLTISGNQEGVKGKLDLDKRPKYRAGIAPANLEMSYYFIIEGTPQKIAIKPQTADTKVNINPNLIWQLFQTGH